MLRHAVIIVVFILLGAVVNVMVSWGIAASPPQAHWVGRGEVAIEGNRAWSVIRSERAVYLRLISNVWETQADYSDDRYGSPRGLLEPWSLDPSAGAVDARRLHWEEMACGWPFISMWLRHTTNNPAHDFSMLGGAAPFLPLDEVDRALVADFDWLSEPLLLPTGIVGPGFMINTAIFSSQLWLYICGPFVIRRELRRKRGLCAQCAYPVGTSKVCTECGAAV